jgi:HEAT repeat protein
MRLLAQSQRRRPPAIHQQRGLPGIDALKAALKDKDTAVRTAALHGLAVAGILPEESTLMPMLEDPETSIRLEAARTICSGSSLPTLTTWP